MTSKEKAIEILKQLDIYKPYIDGFREEDKVCFFEEFAGFWIDQEPEAYKKCKKSNRSTAVRFTPLHTNSPNSANAGTISSSRHIPKNGTTSFTKTGICFARSPTYGTKTTNGAANSGTSASEVSAAA